MTGTITSIYTLPRYIKRTTMHQSAGFQHNPAMLGWVRHNFRDLKATWVISRRKISDFSPPCGRFISRERWERGRAVCDAGRLRIIHGQRLCYIRWERKKILKSGKVFFNLYVNQCILEHSDLQKGFYIDPTLLLMSYFLLPTNRPSSGDNYPPYSPPQMTPLPSCKINGGTGELSESVFTALHGIRATGNSRFENAKFPPAKEKIPVR